MPVSVNLFLHMYTTLALLSKSFWFEIWYSICSFQNWLYFFHTYSFTWILDSEVKRDEKYCGELGGITLNLLSLKWLTVVVRLLIYKFYISFLLRFLIHFQQTFIVFYTLLYIYFWISSILLHILYCHPKKNLWIYYVSQVYRKALNFFLSFIFHQATVLNSLIHSTRKAKTFNWRTIDNLITYKNLPSFSMYTSIFFLLIWNVNALLSIKSISNHLYLVPDFDEKVFGCSPLTMMFARGLVEVEICQSRVVSLFSYT